MRIHKEGYKLIPIMAILIGALYALLYWLIPFAVVQIILAIAAAIFFVLVVRFFRNPDVTTPEKEGVVYAPAEGKVVVIEQTHEAEHLKEDRIQVSIFMSPLNVHVNRSPVKGVIDYFKYHPGKFLVAWHPKSSEENERTTVVIENNQNEVLFRQIAGALAKRIVDYLEEGQNVMQGGEMGFIKFGSRVDVFLPTNAEIKVDINQKVKGNRTVLAHFPK